MAKYIKPLCKICRKYGIKLYLKGRRCESDKCAVDQRRKKIRLIKPKKMSEYGLQLREKNKVKWYYGILERQFKRYFEIAKKHKGVTGEVLLQLLERRLDNVIYKANWVYSRKMAKQIISHGHIIVNGKKNDRPGYLVEIGDVIELKKNSKLKNTVKECIEEYKTRVRPLWLKINDEELKIEVLRYPDRSEVSIPVEEQLIINLYSK
ncbi:MAG: 30S ribosomal protein S4 [bacterium]|nr:30S ribosomal protein S4 [bacterium]MCX7917858.1 30S ribosomal protein S4 [bacterium]MDW8164085.1 30S ribosomal protein S4 [Candidatus Omnitrophota bacterium]